MQSLINKFSKEVMDIAYSPEKTTREAELEIQVKMLQFAMDLRLFDLKNRASAVINKNQEYRKKLEVKS